MPITPEELKTKKQEMINTLLELDNYLQSNMELSKAYSKAEYETLVKEFYKRKFGVDLDAENASMKVHEQYGFFIGYLVGQLEFIGTIKKQVTFSDEYFYRQQPSKDRVDVALKFIQDRF